MQCVTYSRSSCCQHKEEKYKPDNIIILFDGFESENHLLNIQICNMWNYGPQHGEQVSTNTMTTKKQEVMTHKQRRHLKQRYLVLPHVVCSFSRRSLYSLTWWAGCMAAL